MNVYYDVTFEDLPELPESFAELDEATRESICSALGLPRWMLYGYPDETNYWLALFKLAGQPTDK